MRMPILSGSLLSMTLLSMTLLCLMAVNAPAASEQAVTAPPVTASKSPTTSLIRTGIRALPLLAKRIDGRDPPTGQEVDAVLRAWAQTELTEKYHATRFGKLRPISRKARIRLLYGSGHGATLTLLRIREGRKGVFVETAAYTGNRQRYRGTFPPDNGKLESTRVKLTRGEHDVLLRYFSMLFSAKIVRSNMRGAMGSSRDFCVHLTVEERRLAATESRPSIRKLHDTSYCGYARTAGFPSYALGEAARRAIQALLKGKKREKRLVEEWTRPSLAQSLEQEWRCFEKNDSAWWLRSRIADSLGFTKDPRALPVLYRILKDESRSSESRLHYYTVCAVQRLLGKSFGDLDGKVSLRTTRDLVLEELGRRLGR